MNRDEWRNRITEACEAAGTYKPCFDLTIDTLAMILEQRDTVKEEFEQSGQGYVIVTDFSQKQNPLIKIVMDSNKDALAYWRDLGLTPAGLRRIDEQAVKDQKGKTTLADLLNDIGA